jgi:hypothetical protein
MGGGEQADSYLMGTSQFNSQLFEAPLWTVDDNEANVDVQRRLESVVSAN